MIGDARIRGSDSEHRCIQKMKPSVWRRQWIRQFRPAPPVLRLRRRRCRPPLGTSARPALVGWDTLPIPPPPTGIAAPMKCTTEWVPETLPARTTPPQTATGIRVFLRVEPNLGILESPVLQLMMTLTFIKATFLSWKPNWRYTNKDQIKLLLNNWKDEALCFRTLGLLLESCPSYSYRIFTFFTAVYCGLQGASSTSFFKAHSF